VRAFLDIAFLANQENRYISLNHQDRDIPLRETRITDLHHRVAESGATIFLASGERCRSDDRRARHSEFVDKA
jgi:hypothetical protein